MSELHTVWEPQTPPEATSTGGPHTVSQGVKAWGPFHDGRFLVNVGHAEYTPTQALVLAAVIARAALEAGAALGLGTAGWSAFRWLEGRRK